MTIKPARKGIVFAMMAKYTISHETPQTCCKLSILSACYNLSFVDLLQLIETTCSKSMDDRDVPDPDNTIQYPVKYRHPALSGIRAKFAGYFPG